MRTMRRLNRRAAFWGPTLLLLVMLSTLVLGNVGGTGRDAGNRSPLIADDGSKTDPDFG